MIIHQNFIEIFKLDANISKELLECYFSNPTLDTKKGYIMKGNIGIETSYIINKRFETQEFNNNNFKLSNFYDDFFKLNLFPRSEPIILVGPSSYKTELGIFFLESEYNNAINIINLNKKTKIEELLGSEKVFLTKDEINFNLDLLSKISHNDYIKEERLEKMDDIERKIRKEYFPPIIIKIIDNIINNIKNKDLEKKLKNVFVPGSILSSILRQECIIFKNIDQFSMEVFDRFKELFGIEKKLSLNEDIHGTFFPNKKEKIINLKEFNRKINFIGICHENSFQNLSESILARFSIFFVGEYEFEEKEKIIKRILKSHSEIPEKYIDLFILGLKSGQFKGLKEIKFFIDLFSKMNKNNSEGDDNLIMDNFNYLLSSFFLLNEKNPEIEEKYKKNRNILEYIKNKNEYIYSKTSKFKILIFKEPENETELLFTPLFNKLLDLIHFSICTSTPIILEGKTGEGKQEAINYVCQLLNYEVKNIQITKLFTVNDLFNKLKINTNNLFNIYFKNNYNELEKK